MRHPVHQLTWHRVAWQIVSSPECRYSPPLQWSHTTLSFCMPFWKGLWQQLQVHLKSKLEGNWLILHPLRSKLSQYLVFFLFAGTRFRWRRRRSGSSTWTTTWSSSTSPHPSRWDLYFFLEVRFDLKFEFLEIMKLKSDSDAGSVRNGALRKLGGAEQPPKKLPRAWLPFDVVWIG